jgi:methyl-accepting chemotaxis protein
MLKNMKLGVKIIALVCIFLILMAIILVVGAVQTNKTGGEIAAIAAEGIPIIELMTEFTVEHLNYLLNLERALRLGAAEDQAAKSAFEALRRDYARLTSAEKSWAKQMATLQQLITDIEADEHGGSEFRKELEQITATLKGIEPKRQEYEALGGQVFELIAQDRIGEAEVMVKKLADQANEDTSFLLEEARNFTQSLVVEAGHSGQNVIYLMTAIIVIFAVISLGLGLVIARGVTRPVNTLAGVAERVAAGDLSINVPTSDRRDEIGILTQAFRSMVAKLREQIREITEGAKILAVSASEISTSVTQFASSETETATAVSETSATVEEVRQTAQVASEKAQDVSENAQQVAQVSRTGETSTEASIEEMNHIKEQMESIAESVVTLSEQSQAIGAIIATVDDLTEQSNLLAVNASIEAAKAGEQGKGFAVVADEIKSLAEQSKQATAQVRTILNDIQTATSAAVMVTEQGSKAVETGVKQASQTGEYIRELATSVAQAAQAATQIAASSQQQLIGMEQVTAAMESIKQGSIQNVDSAKQLETAAQNLDELGQRLKQLVEQYKI